MRAPHVPFYNSARVFNPFSVTANNGTGGQNGSTRGLHVMAPMHTHNGPHDVGHDIGPFDFGCYGASRPQNGGCEFGSYNRPNSVNPSAGQHNAPNSNLVRPSANLVWPDAPDSIQRRCGPWQTKPRARIHDVDASLYVGLPRILDFNASDFLNTSGSNVNTNPYGSDFSNEDSYVPLPVRTTSWCLDSGASHHVYRDNTTLCDSTPYSDILTLEPLLRGHTRDGLYYFSKASFDSSSSDPSALTTSLPSPCDGDDMFTLWHRRLGHLSASIVKNVIDKFNIVSNKLYLDNICTVCQRGKSHKLLFSCSTTDYTIFF
ncbi:hypothetical protein V6Z12_A07G218800 [Gossypium hirsutum]|uniref:GAG-pre-integrase domain-containing protein n=1 Tax=Gossypium hirsutum TaxID=3635 RepID=A0ABM3BZK2_GOSHI|nr:uncharacterized protein LOC121231812 [Gossypium hirsutum]